MWKKSPVATILIYIGVTIAALGALGDLLHIVSGEESAMFLCCGAIFAWIGIFVYKRKNPNYKPDPEKLKKAPKLMIGAYTIGIFLAIVSSWHRISRLSLRGQVVYLSVGIILYLLLCVGTVSYSKKLYKKRMAALEDE